MFELVGKIMGCSLRLKMCLPFHLPLLVSPPWSSLQWAVRLRKAPPSSKSRRRKSMCVCIPTHTALSPVAVLVRRSGSSWWARSWSLETWRPWMLPPPRCRIPCAPQPSLLAVTTRIVGPHTPSGSGHLAAAHTVALFMSVAHAPVCFSVCLAFRVRVAFHLCTLIPRLSALCGGRGIRRRLASRWAASSR